MNKVKKIFPIIMIVLIIIIGILAVILLLNPNFFKKSKVVQIDENKILKIGILAYDSKDTYVATIIENLEASIKKYELENDIQIRFDIADSKDNQSLQNSQVDRFISLNYDFIILNIVDRTEASTTIDKVMANNIPIIFFNREPVNEDIKRWDKAYYIGFDAKKSAKLQSEIVINKYKEDPLSIDKNQDGIVQYIMLEGESSHQDSLIRTEKSIEYLKSGGLQLERLQGAIADWSRTQAAALMNNFFDEFGDKIELVICNNDDMALGVVDVVKERELDFKNIVGIDGTPPGIDAINDGYMIGTVDINAKRCADEILKLTMSLLQTGKVDSEIELVDNIYIWVNQDIIFSED